MEVSMTQQDPFNPRPQRPPDVDPLPPGSNPPRYGRDVAGDDKNWQTGIIAAAIVAGLVVIGVIVWASTGDHQTATNPPPQTTGQNPAPPPVRK